MLQKFSKFGINNRSCRISFGILSIKTQRLINNATHPQSIFESKARSTYVGKSVH